MVRLSDQEAFYFVASCSGAATCLSFWHIYKHLRNYSEPCLQRYVLRIIFMVPFMATTSLLAFKFQDPYSVYIVTTREIYDAWVIYNFVALFLMAAGGPGAVVAAAEVNGTLVRASCLCPLRKVDGAFLRQCKQGTLQFVLLKPLFATIVMLLTGFGLLEMGNWSPSNGFVYMAVLLNITYSTALYHLLLFYLGTREIIKHLRPGLKFLLIKGSIFVTFWQGVLIAIAVRAGTIPDRDQAEALQNFLVCFETLPAAGLMVAAFPWGEYKVRGAVSGFTLRSVLHALSCRDVIDDFVHQFSSDYEEYVQHEGSYEELVKQRLGAGRLKKNDSETKGLLDMELGEQGRKEASTSASGVSHRRMNSTGSGELSAVTPVREPPTPSARPAGSSSSPLTVTPSGSKGWLAGFFSTSKAKKKKKPSGSAPEDRTQPELLDAESDASEDAEHQQRHYFSRSCSSSGDDRGLVEGSSAHHSGQNDSSRCGDGWGAREAGSAHYASSSSTGPAQGEVVPAGGVDPPWVQELNRKLPLSPARTFKLNVNITQLNQGEAASAGRPPGLGTSGLWSGLMHPRGMRVAAKSSGDAPLRLSAGGAVVEVLPDGSGLGPPPGPVTSLAATMPYEGAPRLNRMSVPSLDADTVGDFDLLARSRVGAEADQAAVDAVDGAGAMSEKEEQRE